MGQDTVDTTWELGSGRERGPLPGLPEPLTTSVTRGRQLQGTNGTSEQSTQFSPQTGSSPHARCRRATR